MQTETGEPTDGDVDLSFPHQTAVMDDAEQKPGEHQAHSDFGVDAWPPYAVRGIAIPDLRPQPAEIEERVHPGQHVIVGDEISKRARHQQLKLTSSLAPQHPAPG